MNDKGVSKGMFDFDGKRYLNDRLSDPNELRWMHGAPPPEDKRITFESDTFMDFPQIRWSLSHMRELWPTASVWHGGKVPSPLEHSDKAADIDALTFADMNGRTRRFDEALFDTYVDGLLVLHRGKVVYERYVGALSHELPHACMSMTKSYAGILVASLAQEGVLDESRLIPHYIPELAGTAWGDATLRQVMDMETGVAYTESDSGEGAAATMYSRATGWQPRPAGYSGPQTMCDYLRTVRKAGSHGKIFAYKSINTGVLGWIMGRVTGRSFAQLLHERLWAPLGCEQDGHVLVDCVGMPVAGGGLSATLRDLARFGELMRREGEWNGRQLISAAAVHEVQRGGAPEKFAKAGIRHLPGYSYRSQWWVTHNELDAFEARGIHGQRLYVAPKAEMVIARFASHPVAGSAVSDAVVLPQMLKLGQVLRT
ncbi:beta-lactamase family protein [Bradyrhizobium sp. CCGB12]|uniref:serine hydrolase domain-containing protein n=1 Tax=Bradyrhizobium sp. CCGB12 TaxID=2949632 RepID=UPI0020B333F9|nr:serine hydrolase [Bradyrhizobium sp. CCGB12]MCP3392262.1 beta-lactamase family protein [Bradyrhizobium sp. CCGB12]